MWFASFGRRSGTPAAVNSSRKPEYDGVVTLREQIEERNRQWRLFHEWEAEQPPVERDASAILADLGALLRWCPAELVRQDPDPEKYGIGKMRAALSLLSSK